MKKGQCFPVRYKAQTPQRIGTILTISTASIAHQIGGILISHLFPLSEIPYDKPKNHAKARQEVPSFPKLHGVSLTLHPEFLALSKRRRYLLGISGGRDSVALLHTLLDHGYNNLVLCHLNHGLRGRESGQDAAFVRRLAKKHALPYEIDRINVAQESKANNESIELAARNARHAFFKQCSRTYRCNRVLLAHHADDQTETILFNLLRGSGGLKGMRLSSQHQINGTTIEFLRPLLETPRCEINAYLTAHQITYREDASNAEAIATRNRLRNEVIPLLKEVMGRDIQPALLRAEEISRTQGEALQDLLAHHRVEDPQGRLFLPKLASLSPALQVIALHGYLKKHSIPNTDKLLLEKCRTLINEQSIAKVNLPGDRHLRRKEKRLFID